jgi:hypothetical protein
MFTKNKRREKAEDREQREQKVKVAMGKKNKHTKILTA